MLPLVVFFLSGFSALLYQVIWQRILVFFSGADVYSVTIVVAAFMAGLGTGSLLGGHAADRLGARRSLWAFALAELLIGVFGLASKALYYDTLYQRFSHLAATPQVTALVLFAILLVPTFLMGLSLPLLARALVGGIDATARVVGTLYGCNTLGAAAGAFATPWVLIPRFGLERPLWIAATVNVLCAALALRMATRVRSTEVRPNQPQVHENAADSVRAGLLPFRLWVAIYGLTGFIALGLEIAWFRLMGVLVKSTSFTFGTLLAVYLFGLGAGAAVGARRAGQTRRPGATFLMLQYGVTLYAAVSTIALVAAIAAGHPIKLVRFLGGYEPVDVYATLQHTRDAPWSDLKTLTPLYDFVMLYVVIPALLIGPPTFLMGLSFPYLQKATQADFGRMGCRLGTLLASNIAGGVLGTIAVGWLLLPALGTAGTLKILVGMGALTVLPIARLETRRQGAAAVIIAAGITGAAVLAMPDGRTLWARLHAAAGDHVLFDEDGAGLSLLKLDQSTPNGRAEVYVNGIGQSWLPYGNVHTALGALPAFIHPAPADVAIIGLGSGDTAFAVAGRADVERVVSIEILSAQLRTLEQFERLRRYPGVVAMLSDPRIEHRIGDGRAHILQAGRRFDIIEADALRPSSAYAGNLYSREYFALLLRHLKPGGLAVSWGPTDRIKATFHNVFPHALIFPGDICIGSDAPIPYDAAAVRARASAARHYYAVAGIDISEMLRPFLISAPRSFGPSDPRVSTDLNSDMFPRDEFALPF